MPASYIYEPYTETFTNESVIRVEHNFGREVNPVVWVDNEEIVCEIEKSNVTGDTPENVLYVRFYEDGVATNLTGKVVVS